MNRKIIFCAAALLFLAARLPATDETNSAAKISPPPPARELRGAWLATVANIDWPSKPGLPVAQQKAELISLLDRAAQLHLNAIYFQVRPVADAFYASPLEPWSEYLTGVQGRSPGYDPLALAVAEAHQRGLQLHAWFNPFRAGHPESKSPPALNHAVRTHPGLIRHYGRQIWFDPGEPEARARALAAVLDVVKRYDVDGIVFDDYFYPYPIKNWAGRKLDFPDDASWKKYGVPSGLTREDWRRKNVNQLVQNVSQAIKAAKPQVQFGISPFGIWRPQNPPQIKGLDAYGTIYADARLWLASGWVDFLAPQLYWPVAEREHSFPVLFNWWRSQNPKGRHIYAGLDDTKFPADEITRQIQTVHTQTSVSGEIHYHLCSVAENPALAAAVRAQYAQTALVPASPWLAALPPDKPQLVVTTNSRSSVSLRWETSGDKPAWLWVLQFQTNQVWTTKILPADSTTWTFDNSKPDAVSIRAVDRVGNLSSPAALVLTKVAPPVRVPRGR